MAPINRQSTTRSFLSVKKQHYSVENAFPGKSTTYSKRKAENSPPKNGSFKRPALGELTNDKKIAKIKNIIKNGSSCDTAVEVSMKNGPPELPTVSVPETRSKSCRAVSGVKLPDKSFKFKSNQNLHRSHNEPWLQNSDALKSKYPNKPITRTSIATRSSVNSEVVGSKTVKTQKHLVEKPVEKLKVHEDLNKVNAAISEEPNHIVKLRRSSRINAEKIETRIKSSEENHVENEPQPSRQSLARLSLKKSISVDKSIDEDVNKVNAAISEETNHTAKLRRSLRINIEKVETTAKSSEENHVDNEPQVSRRSSARLSLRKSLSIDKSTENGSLYVSALEEINNSIRESEKDSKKQFHQLSEFDKELLHDPQQVSLYAMEIFDYLKIREAHFPILDYMHRQPHIDKKMRAMLVDWMVEVQENFELNHETLYLSVKLVDSYLSHVEVRKESLQLVGAAALFLSCKYDERLSPLIDEFEYVGDGAYDKNRLLTMEQNILRQVNYELSFPISYSFLRRYARCARIQMPLLTLARYILELGLMEYDTITLSDSKQAAAALYLAFKMVKHSKWTDSLKYYTGYGVEDFKHIVLLFNRILHQKPASQTMAIRNKYSHELFFKVAETPLISDENLKLTN